MSESDQDQSGAGRREVAYRLFAAEFEDADLSYSESDEERAPNYVVTPTGARVNRLFVVGVLTEVEAVSEDVLRGRIVDPTGAFVTYAGQYQPDEQAFLEGVDTPMFVAVTGKARTFQPEDSDQVFTSIRPESINEVSAETRGRWTVQAAQQTLTRIGHMATALGLDARGDSLREALLERGVDEGLAAGIPVALDHYGTTPTYLDALRRVALDAARVIAGERDEVTELSAGPADSGDVTAADLAGTTDLVDSPDDSVDSGATRPGGTESPETTISPETSEREHATAPDTSGDTGDRVDESEQKTDDAALERGDVGADASDGEADDETSREGSDGAASSAGGEPSRAAGETTGDEDLGDFDPDEYELEDETREEIEEEFGTEFQTGTEVDEPGEAAIETPEPSGESTAGDGAATDDDSAAESSAGGVPESEESSSEPTDKEGEADEDAQAQVEPTTAEPERSAGEKQEPAERPDDVQDAVVSLMDELDDGDGADRETLAEEMRQRYGVEPDETEQAIQGALMDGQCYEPDDTTLKPI
jgi:RPA family protein